jgi:hypothetical protein
VSSASLRRNKIITTRWCIFLQARKVECAACSPRASPVTTRLHPYWDRIERRAIELSVLVIRYTNGATPRTQIRTHDRKLAGEALGFFECDLSVFEDHAALTFEFFVHDEIKTEVGHVDRLPNQCTRELNIERPVSP